MDLPLLQGCGRIESETSLVADIVLGYFLSSASSLHNFKQVNDLLDACIGWSTR